MAACAQVDHGLVFTMASNIKETAHSLKQHEQMLDDLSRSGEEGTVLAGNINIQISKDILTENAIVAILNRRGGQERALSLAEVARMIEWNPPDTTGHGATGFCGTVL